MPNPERAPRSETRIDYTIRPLLNGVCTIAGNHAFAGGDPEERYPYALLVWLVEGGPRPMLVDAGLCDVAEMNRGARHVLAEPITQSPEQRVEAQLAGFGYSPADVGAVFITHLHFDHVDELPRFENAGLYVSARGLAAATQNPGWQGSWAPYAILKGLTETWAERVHAVDDCEVMPGVQVLHLGGHSPCSQAVSFQTRQGEVICTGDTVSLMANMDRDWPIGVYHDLDQCRAAMTRLRQRNAILLPSHDPGVFERFPEGVIGA